MAAPLIGITTSELRSPREHVNRPESEPPMRELALGLTYTTSVVRAGGVPVVVPPYTTDEQLPALLDRLDGVLAPGGPDLHPSLYGQEPQPELGPTEPTLDGAELALVRLALDRRVPLLCICRGAQALNVARGGTLVQHVPGHRQTEPGTQTHHDVRVAPDSRIARVLGATDIAVNSFHHQAVADLGRCLRAVAWADDGVIEGIEATDRPFTLGVQWHAESLLARAEQLALFEAFVAAAAAEQPRRYAA